MRARTEELLYYLYWTCDIIARPTFRNLTDSFEAWAYRSGLQRQLAELARRKLIERDGGPAPSRRNPLMARPVRLTEEGRCKAIGMRDPVAAWKRPWDTKWRLVLFDIPNDQAPVRHGLRKYLRGQGFGCLQESVWITPDPLETERGLLADSQVDVKSLILLEARPCGGENDEEIVAGAWDFQSINKAWANHLEILASRPTEPIVGETSAGRFRDWANKERVSWKKLTTLDPLLPERLCPPDYAGPKVWNERSKAWIAAARQIRNFKP